MSRMSDFGALGLKSLSPEPWGRRLARARINAGYNLRDVEAILAPHISRASLARLEAELAVPRRRQDRARAIVALLLYGVDPTDFGLGPDDLPPATDVRALTRLRSGRSGWLRGIAHQLTIAA